MLTDTNRMVQFIVDWRKEKGFHTPNNLDIESEREAMICKLMLVVTECSEAVECIRKTPEDLNNFSEEIADAIIRLFDISGSMGFNTTEIVYNKMLKNQDRPIKHGTSVSV